MAVNKPKLKAPKPKQGGRKPGRAKTKQPATPVVATVPPKYKLKLKLNAGARKDAQPPVSEYQFPLNTPPLDDPSETEAATKNTLPDQNVQSTRRGARQRTKTQAADMVFGSEMDTLVTSAITPKAEDSPPVLIPSSPPTITATPAPSHLDKAIDMILTHLRNSLDTPIDLPDMPSADATGPDIPYTAILLAHLYTTSHAARLWSICDLIADTWIRALQAANTLSHRNHDSRPLWRANPALSRIFAAGGKGFKKETPDFHLEEQDPDLTPDVTDFDPHLLTHLYAHTPPGCGARLLWADAVALTGRTAESSIVREPGDWPTEMFYDIMCSSLRMVGRKLTLKIEERYEGAWCRYHEHAKYGGVCYRIQAGREKEKEDAGVSGREQGGKRVRFDAGSDVDAEGESEPEGF